MYYINYYKCPDCGACWESDWDSECDDECGECGASNINPISSSEINDDDDVKGVF